MALTASELGVGAPARSSNERIKRELGWQPRFPTAPEGVPDVVARLIAGSAPSQL